MAYFQVYWTNPTPSQCPLAAQLPPAVCIKVQVEEGENQDQDIRVVMWHFMALGHVQLESQHE